MAESSHPSSNSPLRMIGPRTFSPMVPLRQIWDSRRYLDLLLAVSLHRTKVRFKEILLGIARAKVQQLPLMPSHDQAHPVLVDSMLLPRICVDGALTSAASSLVSHQDLTTKGCFPRHLPPLAYLIAAAFDFLIASGILALRIVWSKIWPTEDALRATPVMIGVMMFALGLSPLLGVAFRDVGLALPLVIPLWKLASLADYPNCDLLNPAGVIETFGRTPLQGQSSDRISLSVFCWVPAILCSLAAGCFEHRQPATADLI